MLYEFDLTIAAGTAKASPAELVADLVPGTITLVQVQIPSGCRSLVETSCFRALTQIWPTNPNEALKGDGALITWQEDYDLTDEPLSLTLRGWSPDAAFPHTITWRFAALPLDVKEEGREGLGLLRRLGRSLLGGA